MADYPTVSIVIVNMNGKRHLFKCFTSIMKLNYPKDKIEVIVVDNASKDGSIEFIETHFKWVKLLKNAKNEGFAKPSDDGARVAKGEFVAFLNNDMKVDKDWLIELINTIQKNNAQCAGSVILNYNGKLLDFAGGSATFYGMGYQYNFHKPLSEVKDSLLVERPLLFACGGAMLVNRRVFLDCGGFDENYFAFFEDVDLGWRMNVLGYKIFLSAKSYAFHKHHSTGGTFSAEKMQVLYERNSLYTIYKNYGEKLLQTAFWPSILLDVDLTFLASGISREAYDLQADANGDSLANPIISDRAGALMCALHDFIKNLPELQNKRDFIQGHRVVADQEIIQFMDNPFGCYGKDITGYSLVKYDLIKVFGMDKVFNKDLKRKVLVVCNDRIGIKMAGPAIRYFEFAKNMSKTCEVVLASRGKCDIKNDHFRIIDFDYQNCAELDYEAMQADIIIVQGYVLKYCEKFKSIAKEKYLVIDLYDPFVIENIEVFKNQNMKTRCDDFNFSSDVLLEQLKIGDFFIAANEKQANYWLGMLSALKRVSPEMYDISPNYSKLIDTVPFGISDEAPKHSKNMLKGVWPGINQDDFVLIWGGGVWNWFDPLTLIKAVYEVSKKRDNVKLFFLGVKHPNKTIPNMEMLAKAVDLAKSLGVYNKKVFFNFNWVEYEERQNYLLEADAGVSCHFNTLETRLSFRTRILDYLWADLPIICTKGDYFADLISAEKLGLTVDYQDTQQLADAIVKLMDDKKLYMSCKENIVKVAGKYKWSVVTKPLADYCAHPLHHDYSAEDTEQCFGQKGNIYYRKGNVNQRLDSVEHKVQSIVKITARNKMDIMALKKRSDMMDRRFEKLKKIAGPFLRIKRFLSRIIHRRG